MSGDVAEARKLIAAKAELRSAELIAAERHLERLREGRPESLETTSLHLDVRLPYLRQPILSAAIMRRQAAIIISSPASLATSSTAQVIRIRGGWLTWDSILVIAGSLAFAPIQALLSEQVQWKMIHSGQNLVRARV